MMAVWCHDPSWGAPHRSRGATSQLRGGPSTSTCPSCAWTRSGSPAIDLSELSESRLPLPTVWIAASVRKAAMLPSRV